MLACLAAALASTAGSTLAVSQNAAPIQVVASNSVVADLLTRVGGSDVAVLVVSAGDTNAHHSEPTIGDAKKIAGAAATFVLGLGLDTPVSKMHAAAKANGALVELGTGLAVKRVGACQHEHDHEHDHAGDAPIWDPHVWHDPTKVSAMASRVAEALSAQDPAHKEAYTQRAAKYQAELTALDDWIRIQLATIPVERRLVVTTHDGLAYYASRYDLRIVGIDFTSDGGTDADASPQRIVRLVEEVRATKSPVVFADASHSDALESTVAREANVRLVSGLRLDGLAAETTYLDMMRKNTQCMVEALRE